MNDSVASTFAAATPGKKAAIDPWRGFQPGDWQKRIDVRDFIVRNTKSYHGDESFLAPATERTKAVFAALQPYFKEEIKKGVLDVDAKTPSSLTAHAPRYIVPPS
jgi:formate C-acetyltransferase